MGRNERTLEDEMKKIIALFLVAAISSMIFACNGNSESNTTTDTVATEKTSNTTAQTTTYIETNITEKTEAATSATTTATSVVEIEPTLEVTPYADLDFVNGKVVDACGKVTVELKSALNGVTPAFVENTEVTFNGVSKSLPAFRTTANGQYGELTFNEVSSDDFYKFVSNNGGLTFEAFYLDRSDIKNPSAIICGTESVGGNCQAGGFGIAQRANRSPYAVSATRSNSYATAEKTGYVAPNDELIHVVAVLNEEDWILSLYINGKKVSSKSTGEAFITNSDKTDINSKKAMGNMFLLGADPTTRVQTDGVDFPSNDLTIVDIKIYDKALTADEVSVAYEKAISIFD